MHQPETMNNPIPKRRNSVQQWLTEPPRERQIRRLVLVGYSLSIILSIALSQMIAVVLFLIAAVVAWKAHSFVRTPFDVPLAAFVVARVVSVFLSSNFALSVRTLYAETPYFLLFYALVQVLFRDDDRVLTAIFWSLTMGGIAASVYGTGRVLFGFQLRASSTSSGYYTLGTYLACMAAIVLFLGRNRRTVPNRFLWSIALFFLLLGLTFTFNRTHWAITAFMLLLAGTIRERWLLLVAVIGAIAAFIFLPSVATRFYQTTHFTSYLSDRDVLWKGGLMLAKEHPVFGFGPGTFREIFPLLEQLSDKKVGGWHNDFLQVYLESGIFGLAALLWVLASVARQVVRSVTRIAATEDQRDLVLAAAMGIAAIVFSSLIGSGFLDVTIILLNVLLLAFLVRADLPAGSTAAELRQSSV